MKFLVTTTQAVLILDAYLDRVAVIHEGAGLYYGASWSDKEIYLASRPGLNDVTGATLHVYDYEWNHIRDQLLPQILDLHQIHIVDNELWVASSGQDLFWVYDLVTGQALRQFCPVLSKTLGVSDSHHFNSVLVRDDKIYTLAHNRGMGSFICVHDRQTQALLRRIDNMGFQSHNIWVSDELGLVTLNSGEAALTCEHRGRLIEKLPLDNAFPRGLAVTESEIAIGISPHESDPVKRLEGPSSVLLYDRQFKHRKSCYLGDYGSVYEVRALDQADECHPDRPIIDDKRTNKVF